MTTERNLTVAARRIIDARDQHADDGSYPPHPDGPGKSQCFDDWACDLLEDALKGVDPERGSVRTTIGDGEDEFGVTITWDGGGIGIDVDGFKEMNDNCIVYMGAWEGAPEAIVFPDINDEEAITIKFHDAAAHLYQVDDPPYTGWNLVRETIERHTHKED
jgi:hypothetical protein